MIIELSSALTASLIDEALLHYPRECCGVLMGSWKNNRNCMIRKSAAIKNLADKDRFFLMDVREQFDVARAARKNELEIVGHYHSHPSGDSALSEWDKNFALHAGQLALIVAAQPDTSSQLRCYYKSDTGIIDVDIKTTDIKAYKNLCKGADIGFR